MTPPPAIVALMRVSSSSSPRMANCKCLGVILLTLRSLLAFPASSRTSAVRYSRIAEVYTAAVAPTRWLERTLVFKKRWRRPTGNCSPDRIERDVGLRFVFPEPTLPPLPPFPPLPLPADLIFLYIIIPGRVLGTFNGKAQNFGHKIHQSSKISTPVKELGRLLKVSQTVLYATNQKCTTKNG